MKEKSVKTVKPTHDITKIKISKAELRMGKNKLSKPDSTKEE